MNTTESSQDFYQLLGVSRDCSQSELKKAYRKRVLEYHPDRHPESATDAQQKFHDVTHAYQVLADEDQRKRYNRIGHVAFVGFHSSSKLSQEAFVPDFSAWGRSMLSSAVDTATRLIQKNRVSASFQGEDIECQLDVTFEQAALGTEQTLSYKKKVLCEACNGFGNQPGTEILPCQHCEGVGTYTPSEGILKYPKICSVCSGMGCFIFSSCERCGGNQSIRIRHEVQVQVPPGVRDGALTVVKGEGDAGLFRPSASEEHRQSVSGDLQVKIHILPHPFFTRDGADIRVDVPLSYCQLTLGDTVEVPTVEGKVNMKIPAGTQSETVFRLRGKGMVSRGGSMRGDQLVRAIIEIPTKVTQEQRTLLETLGQKMGATFHPKKKNFLVKLKELFN